MKTLPPQLSALAAYPQFILWKLVGKDKLPVSPYTGQVCDPHDSANWATADFASAALAAGIEAQGLAFAFTDADPFFFIDLDHALVNGQWSELALRVMGMFPEAAKEISQSGTGGHIIGKGRCGPHKCKNIAAGLELYTEKRFVALTGTNIVGDAGTEHSAALQALVDEFFPPDVVAVAHGDGPDPEWRGPTDDDELIRRAMASKSAASVFGQRASFADLWERRVEVLARVFPGGDGRDYDESSADAALLSHLAFWTGRDAERMHRLMLRSGLVRDKWNRPDYLQRSIDSTLARPGDVLKDKATIQTEGDPFAGCVYIQNRHRALVPGGILLKPEQFNVRYGGKVYVLDPYNSKITRKAWEAFTESELVRPATADSICFRPELEPGVIVDVAGRTYANTWWPANVERRAGDVSPFLIHLEKLFPVRSDQEILLAYMAACVQHQGIKFQWAPVIQGAEGNGKTLLSACVAEAIGPHYTHWLQGENLKSQFNAWLDHVTFVALEELYYPEHALEMVEKMKLLISGGRGIQIEAKGVDQESMRVCANFMITTNHRNAVKKTADNARRLAVMYSAQQSKADIERDGMGEATGYFPNLWDWLRSGGFAAVSEYLYTYPIPTHLNPAGALHRAPKTSSTDEAIRESAGAIEQHIEEAIAQGTPGMMGGWISSTVLDRLLSETLKVGARLTHTKRRDMLKEMGYVRHPGLPDGRVNNPVAPDNRCPRLYILENHPNKYLTGAAEIAKAYSAAQLIG